MQQDNYSKIDQIFHQIALGGRATSELFFDLETGFFGKDLPDSRDGKHVFVSGLARAGTTILMRMLHATDEFSTLTYRDMPLVMAPNLWRKLSGGSQKKAQEKERAHGDGLAVGFDSPEALEEVFWRTFSGPEYIQRERLVPMKADTEVIDQFREYVSLILKRYGHARYLSKNNNSILRLGSLLEAFPRSTILIPFRHPASHAASLKRQHEHFLSVHRESSFSRNYMTWLVHHEFGGDHRPFDFGAKPFDTKRDPSDLSYWIDRWIEAYTYLEKQQRALGERAVFVCYDDLVANPQLARTRLSASLELDLDDTVEIKSAPAYAATETDNLTTALSLYETLRERNLIQT